MRGGEVTTPGQMSVKFICLHVTVLIKVSMLNVGTRPHTHSICIPHVFRFELLLAMAAFFFFFLKGPKGVTISA